MLDARSGIKEIANPKLNASDPSRRFYPYYAGFSENFVSDALSLLRLEKGDVVLDPWVGTGTTTTVAARAGYRAIGVDRNPVLVAIATARSVPPEHARAILSTIKSGLLRTSRLAFSDPADPLLTWFSPKSVETFRAFQGHSLRSLGARPAAERTPPRFSDAEALLHVVFFRAARRLAASVLGSNPTWISQKTLERRISVPALRLRRLLAEEIGALQEHFALHLSNGKFIPRLLVGDTAHLDRVVTQTGVAAIIASPPYGTRIDYGIATSIELACLATYRSFNVDLVRRSLIGTTLTSHDSSAVNPSWGTLCNDFLNNVRAHPSKASATYYSRYYENYFSGLWRSFYSLDKVTSSNSRAILVLQGSYYKEIYLDLPSIACQMLKGLGWQLVDRVDREVRVSFTLLNPDARRYLKPHPPVESVIQLEHAEDRWKRAAQR